MSATDAPVDTVKNFVGALESNNLDEATGYLSDAFIFSGWTPRPLDKKGFLSLIKGLKEGMPGLIFNLHNVADQDRGVTATMQITGYQSDSFLIPSMGTPIIPQTANSVSLPAEDVTFMVNEDKITSMDLQAAEGGGINGLFRQLGIDLTTFGQ